MVHRCAILAVFVVCQAASASDMRITSSGAVDLTSFVQNETPTQTEIVFEASGSLKLAGNGKINSLPMRLDARLSYLERRLPADSVESSRGVRHYQKAEATLVVDGQTMTPSLSESRRTIGVEFDGAAPVLYSPAGPLSRDELDLITLPGNTLLLNRLLPSQITSVNDRWEHAPELIAALFSLDAVSQTDIASELVSVEDGTAKINLAGRLQGAVEGVATEIELKGSYKVDVGTKRITWFAVLIREKRSIGHVGPGLEVTARLTVRAESAPADVSQVVPSELAPPSADQFLVLHESPVGKYRLQHVRKWHLMHQVDSSSALRLVENGELVAQCNVTALPDALPGQHPPLDRFRADIQKALGENFEQFEAASEGQSPRGYTVYRVVAAGKVADVDIQWRYYLVANPRGRMLSLAFTVERALVDTLAAADEVLAGSVEFIEPEIAFREPAAK